MVSEDYKNWLNEAKWDLETSEILKNQKRYNSFAFFAQQAVEKLLKSALLFYNESPWGHSTRELVIRFDKICNLDLSSLVHNASELDLHYIPSRYPNTHPNSAPHEVYDPIIAQKAIDNANRLFEKILSIFEQK
ncbi:MAG: HEPN domain-containing protein [Promethearchaeota archaeon]